METRYFNQYDSEHYLKLSGAEDYVAQLSQTVTVPESGVYSLDFVIKNLGLDASVIGEYNSLELTVAVDGKIQAYQMITPSSGLSGHKQPDECCQRQRGGSVHFKN